MKISRARVTVQILVHVILLLHLFAYYSLDWKQVGGADMQSFFHDFLGSGLISAGVILTVVAFLATLVFGRFFCGWGCHFGAFQDFAAWILSRMGGRGLQPVQTRFLHLLPYALLLFAFLVPAAARFFPGALAGQGSPPFDLRVDLGGDPWANLPGFLLTVVTFLACGVGLLFFLGTRGFCRYVCPYGAVFRVLGRPAPYRVRLRKSCAGCGTADASPASAPALPAPCTAACPMGVQVHQETHLHGAVVNDDCVRCGRCIDHCPGEALEFSFRPIEIPVLSVRPTPAGAPEPSGRVRPVYTFSLGREILIASFASVSFAAWDLVYAAHFLAAAMALGEAFMALLTLELFTRRDLSLLAFKLRHRGRWTFAGAAVPAIFLLTLVAVFQASAFKVHRFSANRSYHAAGAIAYAAQIDPGTPRRVEPAEAEALGTAADLYQKALRYYSGDRVTIYRYAATLAALGDRRAIGVAEDLLKRAPRDRDARELLRRVRDLFQIGPIDARAPMDLLDNSPGLR